MSDDPKPPLRPNPPGAVKKEQAPAAVLSAEQLADIRAQVRAELEAEAADKALKAAEELAGKKAQSREASELAASEARGQLLSNASKPPAGCLRAMVRKAFHVDRSDIVGLPSSDGASIEVHEGDLIVMKEAKIRMLEGQGLVRSV